MTLKMWKDPGYTRNCADVPPLGSKKLPTPDFVNPPTTDYRPHKDSTLTALNLPLSYTDVFDMSYLYIEAIDQRTSTTGNRIKLFGWIDSITQRSTYSEGVTIRWTVDWWRSYSGDVSLDTGMIVKCPNGTYKRPYRTQPRYWKVRYHHPIHDGKVPGTKLDLSLWVYVFTVWNKVVSGTTTDVVTQSRILCAPVNADYKFNNGSTATAGFPINYMRANSMNGSIATLRP